MDCSITSDNISHLIIEINNVISYDSKDWILRLGDSTFISFDSAGQESEDWAIEAAVEGRNFMTWSAISVPEGGYRLYGNFPGPGGSSDISSVFSEDGENWTIEPGTRLSAQGADSTLESQFAADHGLAISSDGTYLLAYLEPIRIP